MRYVRYDIQLRVAIFSYPTSDRLGAVYTLRDSIGSSHVFLSYFLCTIRDSSKFLCFLILLLADEVRPACSMASSNSSASTGSSNAKPSPSFKNNDTRADSGFNDYVPPNPKIAYAGTIR